MAEATSKGPLARLISRIALWYAGDYEPIENNPESGLIILSRGRLRRPLLARIIAAVCSFLAREWKWIIGVVIALLAIAAKFFFKD